MDEGRCGSGRESGTIYSRLGTGLLHGSQEGDNPQVRDKDMRGILGVISLKDLVGSGSDDKPRERLGQCGEWLLPESLGVFRVAGQFGWLISHSDPVEWFHSASVRLGAASGSIRLLGRGQAVS